LRRWPSLQLDEKKRERHAAEENDQQEFTHESASPLETARSVFVMIGSSMLPDVWPDAGSLFLSTIASGIGLVLFIYGKKQQRAPHLVAGLLLMVYPYFVSSVEATLAVGLLIGAVLWWVVRQGW